MTHAPQMRPAPGEKLMSTSFPKRDELPLRTDLAFPKASRIGLVCSTLSSTPPPPARSARNRIACLVVSVFPEPDSPLMRMLWSRPRARISECALRARP